MEQTTTSHHESDVHPSPPQTRWIVEWALGAVALGGASLLVPLYVVELGGTPFILGVLASTAAIVGVPSALVMGRLADRSPRLVFLLESVLLTILAVLAIFPFVSNLAVIVVLNAILWAAFAGAAPVLNLLAVAGAEESAWQKRIARLNTFQGWGWAGGLVLGVVWLGMMEARLGTLDAHRIYFGLCMIFGAVAAFGLALDAPSQSALRRLDPRKLRMAVLRSPRMNIRGATFPFTPGRVYDWTFRKLRFREFVTRFTPPLAVYYIAALLFFAGFAVFFAPLPIYLDDVGFSPGAIFGLYLLSSIGAAVSFGFGGRLAQKYDLSRLQSCGLVVRGIAMPAVVAVGGVAGVAWGGMIVVGSLFFVIGASWAVIAVTAATLVVRLSPVSLRGEALGFFAATSALAGALGSLLGGGLAEFGYGLAFSVSGALVLLGAVLVLVVRALSSKKLVEVTETVGSEPPKP